MGSKGFILSRYLIMGAVLCFLLLVMNLAFLLGFLDKGFNTSSPQHVLESIAELLAVTDQGYALHDEAESLLIEEDTWVILLDESGDTKWSINRPQDVQGHFTLTDVAQLSRYFYKDYPTFVWESNHGLLIMGYPKSSIAKYFYILPVKWVQELPLRLVMVLMMNLGVALLIALIMGLRMVANLNPIFNGIQSLAYERRIKVKEKGLLEDLAKHINGVSSVLHEKDKALKERDHARSNWIASISHDIRTPLSMILGYASSLEEDRSLSEEQRREASIIRQQGERLGHLVKDLNLVSLLEYDMQPIHLNQLFLPELVRQVVTDFYNTGLDERYGITINSNDHDHVKIMADEKLIKRGLENLIRNAMKHNPQGCRIHIVLSSTKEEGMSTCIIKDDGVGIEPELLDELLKQPYDLSRKHKPKSGHGLGLPIVAGIVKAHKGSISLNSQIGKGMEVTIHLPINR